MNLILKGNCRKMNFKNNNKFLKDLNTLLLMEKKTKELYHKND